MMYMNLCSGFPTRSDTNWAVQPQKIARGLTFWVLVTIFEAKTKALISCRFAMQLIAFVFAYAIKRIFP